MRWNSYQDLPSLHDVAGSSRTMKTSVGVEKANFFVHYECDDETVKHVLKLDGYDGVGCCSS